MSGRIRSRSSIRVLTSESYETPKVKVRRKKPGAPSFDLEAANALREKTGRNGNQLKPNGQCHDCGKTVTGERKFCGPCLAKH